MVGQVEKSRRRTAALIGAAVILSVEGCFSPPPPQHLFQSSSITSHLVSHTVERGDTIYHIAHLYGVTPQRLMAANGLTNPRQLEVGQRLIIPLRRETAASASLSPWPLARADRQFAWPITDGVVSSPFGIRNGVMHDGVDIVAHAGTPIRAADNGTVIFSGHLHG
ncbi:MAG TPA: LysM peptidoglycan-binding domain-containing protein, partial [Candidatus Binataceae bacterium]|nr:LysM peptidoglycan-binding domain-containing protein [Candidatus Binataceae bacterium]